MEVIVRLLGAVALLFTVATATLGAPPVAFPGPPVGAPVVRQWSQTCSLAQGFYVRVYDTDPGGSGAYTEIGVYTPADTIPYGPVVAVIKFRAGEGEFEGAWALVGGQVRFFGTREELSETVGNPCNLIPRAT